jgi:flagellar basal-body rod protein FlgF
VFLPNGDLSRVSGTYFTSNGGVQATETATIIQGALEASNTSPVAEMARMIEVQRAYESGQNLLDSEEKRITQLISALRER